MKPQLGYFPGAVFLFIGGMGWSLPGEFADLP